MRPLHNGRAGTQVFPTQWAPNVGAVLSKTLPDTCTISHSTRAGSTVFDKTNGVYTGPPPVREVPDEPPVSHFTGPCRVENQESMSQPEAGGEAIPTVTYVVALAAGAAPLAVSGDILVASTGVTLRVESIAHGATHEVERRLYCTEDQS